MRLSHVMTLALAFNLVACANKTKTPDVQAPPAITTTGKVEAKVADVKNKVEKATANATSAMDRAECTLKTETRNLEVRAKGKGCELAYTKGGTEKIIATSAHGASHCQAAMKKIQDNLTKANYTCK